MTTINPNRVAPGVPAGGQFAAADRPEADTLLSKSAGVSPDAPYSDYFAAVTEDIEAGIELDQIAQRDRWGQKDWERYYETRGYTPGVDACPDCGITLTEHNAFEDGVCLSCADPTTYAKCNNCGQPVSRDDTYTDPDNRGQFLCQPCGNGDDFERCADCGVVYSAYGDGWEGRCGDCADRHEAANGDGEDD